MAILEAHVPELEVWAFGSRVTGRPRRTSDLDLVLVTETPLPPARMADLRDAFSESDLPFKVDLVDWAATKENFREIIQKGYVVLKGGDKNSRTGREPGVERRCRLDWAGPGGERKAMGVKKEEKKKVEGPAWRAAREYGFDMSLLEENLHRSPAERIRFHSRALALAEILRKAMKRKRSLS